MTIQDMMSGNVDPELIIKIQMCNSIEDLKILAKDYNVEATDDELGIVLGFLNMFKADGTLPSDIMDMIKK